MAFKIKDLMINVLPTGPGIVCGPGGTCTAITPECGQPTIVCNPGVNPATVICGVAVTHGCTAICSFVHCTVACTANCSASICQACSNVASGCTAPCSLLHTFCACTALCTANCSASVCQACSNVASGCTALCSLGATPCGPCSHLHTCGCTIHSGCGVVSGCTPAAISHVTPVTGPIDPGPEARFSALSALKEELKQQLAEVEKQHAEASASLLPQTVEQVDELTKKLQDALEELKSRRAELAKKAKPAEKK